MNDMIEVTAAVAFCGGRLLLATRRPGSHLAGQWEFPGGKVEIDETLENCIRRELREELALEVSEASLFFDFIHAYPGKPQKIFLHFMYCRCREEAVAVPREGQLAEWFSADELPENLAGADGLVLECLKAGRYVQDNGLAEDIPIVRDKGLFESFSAWLAK